MEQSVLLLRLGAIFPFSRLHAALLSHQPLFSRATRANMARRRNLLYVKSEKLLALLSSGRPKRILLSGNPDWSEDIESGFRRLPHQVECGSITKDSFQRYDIVVPLSISALKEARRHAPQQKIALPLPAAESVRLCDDKYELNQTLVKAGFGRYIPKTAQGLALSTPYILKKRVGWWGKDCYIVSNAGEEQSQLHRITDPAYFCQELILRSSEFATHILFIGGRIVKALNIKYEFPIDTPIKGQDQDDLKVIHRCPYLHLFAQILRTIQFEGLCCFNYKVERSQMFLLEINPRFGGSLGPYFFSFIRHLR